MSLKTTLKFQTFIFLIVSLFYLQFFTTSCMQNKSEQNFIFAREPTNKSSAVPEGAVGFLNEDIPWLIRQALNLPQDSDILKHHVEAIKELKFVEKRQYSQNTFFFHQDFEKFPHLEKIIVEYRTQGWLHRLLKESAQKTQRLELTYKPQDPLIRSAFSERPVPLTELTCTLRNLKKLKSLQISQLKSEELLPIHEGLSKSPVMSLQINQLLGDLEDSHVEALNKMRYVSHLALGLTLTQLKASQAELKNQVKSVKLKFIDPRTPGHLEHLDIDLLKFVKNAEFMTIVNVAPKTLASEKETFRWTSLLIENEDPAAQDAKPQELTINTNKFPHMILFLSRPDYLRLSPESRSLLESRRSMKLFERALSIMEAVGQENQCAGSKHSSTATGLEFKILEKIRCLMKF